MVAATETHVKSRLAGDTTGHDWWHVDRVRRIGMRIASAEGADIEVVELATLLHDISDHKFNGGDYERGPREAAEFLIRAGEPATVAMAVASAIRSTSWSGRDQDGPTLSLEAQVVQDADRLDAIGAIGIGRAFAYGGYAQQPMHDPCALDPSTANTVIAHFYEKLLRVKDRLHTQTAKQIATARDAYMRNFLQRFYEEWNADDSP
ncbi:HD domain-containing protein [Solirubrobacter deserti]|uniref:HD domain-containing protein n=1 Tax=Solirubrobacter deserti TaxID=2282478 RepID=A0ABT4RQT2_9ACTN|nr:HD domain-containing protein [Solirubrobacter deserti]MDA0140925.1 HD domain-containing protein [Solirubrobacter deserti]